MNLKSFTASTAIALMMSTSAQAAVEVFTWESGTDVLASYYGSLDVTGMTFLGPLALTGGVDPSSSLFGFGSGSVDAYTSPSTSVVGTAGTGSYVFSPRAGGDIFSATNFLGSALISVPVGYTSGTPLSGSMTFSNQTLAAMGLTTGQVVYSLPNDTVTWNIGTAPAPAVIPLPAGLPLALAGLGTLTWLRRRKG